ncbi:CRISPR-associated helicase Cas3' [Desulfohalovibrio reitneri]|uniref:CRISPR-associated helicase Cas3' n=1 Tax=Desulfohalovibrio reitneri TaxID=1307759 RepID=UPI001EFFB190|nr:CRISPR-associated helicase Cas3' [Desulfohalovibrio reitneri]
MYEAGVVPPTPTRKTTWADLFPDLTDASPTPLQEHARSVDIPDSPQLHILEDLTGSGKTEAAVILAARLMARDLGDGFFFALPTMATANSMYSRLAPQYHQLFEVDADRPSFMLAHGARGLNELFLQSTGLDDISQQGRNPSGNDAAEPVCARWLADNRKKALLAPTGAATLDQALLGVLPVSHQCLRLLGLGRNVLIADEIHSFDPYVTGLLAHLLEIHAARGGSAVLLSATLSAKTRGRLTDTFRRGLETHAALNGIAAIPHSSRAAPSAPEPYPSASLASLRGCPPPTPVDPAPWAQRELHVEHVKSREDVLNSLAGAARNGACAAYVCNTVDDALEVWRALRGRSDVDPGKVVLLHARFALGDRLDIEADITSRFGKPRKDAAEHAVQAEGRAGWIVVGTQVLEMSLDLDFDIMASDLAPVDALLQRAGRLQRHAFERPEGYEAKRLLLHAPPWDDSPGSDWYAAHFKRAQWIYRVHGELWLTLRELRRRGTLHLPWDVRVLIETVYDPEGGVPGELAGRDDKAVAEGIPETLLSRDAKEHGERIAAGNTAAFRALDFEEGYSILAGEWTDSQELSTRLGGETVTFRLAKERDGHVVSWRDPQDDSAAALRRAWALSEIRLRPSMATEPLPPDVPALATQLRRLEEDHPGPPVALLQERERGWLLRARKNGEVVELAYNADKGLTYELTSSDCGGYY